MAETNAAFDVAVRARAAPRGPLAFIGAFALEWLVLLSAPVLLVLTRYFSWGAGNFRFLTLLALFVLIARLTRERSALYPVSERRPARAVLLAALVFLFGFNATIFVRDVRAGEICMTDMGRPSICAGEWWLKNLNPWSQCAPARRRGQRTDDTYGWCLDFDTCIDWKGGGTYVGWTHHKPGFDFMDGYKYGPLSALVYFPVTHFFREQGLYAVNFAFWLALALLCFDLGRRAYPQARSGGARALCGFLLPAAMPLPWILPVLKFHLLGRGYWLEPPEPYAFVRELTTNCANDVIPLVFALLGVALAARQRWSLSGAVLGLSLASKQLPAPLVIALVLGMQGVDRKRLLAGVALSALALYWPFFLQAPREMVANLVLFGFERPTNGSSVRPFLPQSLQGLVGLAQLGMAILLIARFHASARRDLAALFRACALLVIAFVALNKVVHGNYLLWIQPFTALALAGLPFGEAGAASTERGGASAGAALQVSATSRA